MEVQAAYEDVLRYMYERLPMFSRIGKEAIKQDLDNIKAFCDALENPQNNFKSIHIAGTNGKGSTSHMMAAVLQEAGYKVGLYTSPHLTDFRERIRIDGKPVSKEWVVGFINKHKPLIEKIEPSFFEITVAMAFVAFAEEEVDIAVIETGLGGRLDSTNIILPLLSIITNISYDHKDILGNTLKEIAAEKAGIIKPGVPVLIGEQDEETERVFFETALHNQSRIYYAEAVWDLVRTKQDSEYQYFKAVHKAYKEMYDLQTDLLGTYQQHNIKTILAATELLIANQGLSLSIAGTIKALGQVKKLTGLRGRWERLCEEPLIIADVAHNAAGLKEVFEQWKLVDAKKKHIVVGFVKDKDVQEALSAFPRDAEYHFCNAAIPRALPAKELLEIAEGQGLRGTAYSSVAEALQAAKTAVSQEDALLVVGSFFIVGEAVEYLEQEGQVVKEQLTVGN
jgi:dihydrofolate synthase / folylpolyglutamate synthase